MGFRTKALRQGDAALAWIDGIPKSSNPAWVFTLRYQSKVETHQRIRGYRLARAYNFIARAFEAEANPQRRDGAQASKTLGAHGACKKAPTGKGQTRNTKETALSGQD
jgi:hypothetical protein